MAIETIYITIQTFIYTLLLYSMIGFELTVGNFLWFYYYILMCFIYFTMYGLMVVALTPNQQIAAIAMSFFLNFWNLFSGFLIPRPVSELERLKHKRIICMSPCNLFSHYMIILLWHILAQESIKYCNLLYVNCYNPLCR